MDQQTLPLAGPRISRVTLGRLHNLGNYEHIRYEVSVELPPGTAPASVIGDLEDMLNDLEPRSPVPDWDLRVALKDLLGPEPTLESINALDEDGPFDGGPEHALAAALRRRSKARDTVNRHHAWQASREAALARFNELGGKSAHTDAKDRWDDEENRA
jgi:hypothetical protein